MQEQQLAATVDAGIGHSVDVPLNNKQTNQQTYGLRHTVGRLTTMILKLIA